MASTYGIKAHKYRAAQLKEIIQLPTCTYNITSVLSITRELLRLSIWPLLRICCSLAHTVLSSIPWAQIHT